MRIGLVIERTETWRGGAETSTLQFGNHLANLGCEVIVFTRSHVPSTPNLRIVPVAVRHLTSSGKFARFIIAVPEYARAEKVDILHCIAPCPGADVYQPRGGTVPEMIDRNAAMRRGPARLFKKATQQLRPKYHLMQKLERALLKQSPRPWVIAISQYVADQVQQHYNFDHDRVRLIFNAVDPDEASEQTRKQDRITLRRQFNLASDDIVFLCVAHNFKLKGVDALIQALAEISNDDGRQYHALIVGRGNPAAFAKRARALSVADRVRFVGPSQRVHAFFHAADVLVHPTYYDPCSRVVLEALGSGLPVITTRYNGAAERMTEGVHGHVIDSPTNTAALVSAMRQLSDNEHRGRCAERAPEAVRGLTMREHAQGVVRLYEEIMQQKHAQAR